jgi:DNA-binding NtrC family response regulator
MTTKPRTLDDLLKAYERIVIMETLSRNSWNRRLAADALHVSRRRLMYRLKALHVDLTVIPRAKSGPRKKVDTVENGEMR